jgi:tetratricopeptide (TPR) repeat protein
MGAEGTSCRAGKQILEAGTGKGVNYHMNRPRNSLLTRVARSSLDLAVRHWPESSRQWGQAMLADGAAVSWAVGGMLLFAKAMMVRFLEWMRQPAGTGFSGAGLPSGSKAPQYPKHSRLATAVILLSGVTLFFLPIGREAATTVQASWRGFIPSEGDRQDLEKIAVRAEKEKDAWELAFVALSYPETDRARLFADRAVELDPKLVWIYAARYHDRQDWSQSVQRLERLKSIDRDNAFAYLVNAYAQGELGIEDADARRGISVASTRDTLASDGEWLEEMDQAFRAPNYDSYHRRHEELLREGWRNNPNLSPGLVAMDLWAHGVPDALQLLGYADLRVGQAVEAGSAGNEKAAEAILGELTSFGRRMTANSSDFFGYSVGMGVTKRGLEGFRKLYGTNGQANKRRRSRRNCLK